VLIQLREIAPRKKACPSNGPFDDIAVTRRTGEGCRIRRFVCADNVWSTKSSSRLSRPTAGGDHHTLQHYLKMIAQPYLGMVVEAIIWRRSLRAF